MLFVDRISVQHFILRDQAARAFGEEDLVAELDWRLHLAALDEVGMGFENRIELLDRWNLLAVEHTAARPGLEHVAHLANPGRMDVAVAAYSCSIWPTTLFRRCAVAAL